MTDKISTVLQTLEQHILAAGNAEWNISHETGIFLNTLVRMTQPARILEIGTSTGYSGIWLAEPLAQFGGQLITVESHLERFQTATKHFTDTGLQNVVSQVYGHAPEILSEIQGTFDLMFFDATKLEHQSYFDACENKLKKNGLIITDNVISHQDELASYISNVQKKDNFQTSILNIGTGIMLSLKLD